MFGAFPPPAYPRPYPLGEALRKKKDVSGLLNRYVQDLLSVQRKAGLNALTDGRLLWDNVVEGSASLLEGWEKGDLTRFFDNNYFFRRPIKKALRPASRLADELKLMPFPNRLLPVLGPFSFSSLASGRAEVDLDYGNALASALSGYEGYLVIEEPSLLFSAGKEAISSLAESLRRFPPSAKKIVMTYFAPFSKVYPSLLDLPVEGLWLDCVSDADWKNALSEYGGKPTTVLGLVDARNTRMESPKEVADAVKRVELSGDVFVAPNWGFDIIPYAVSKQKTRLLGRIRGLLEVNRTVPH